MSPPGAQLAAGAQWPQYIQYPPTFDSVGSLEISRYLGSNGEVNGTTEQGTYAFYLNEIRSAIQNVSSSPHGESAFACNPANPGLDPLLQYLYAVQGISGDGTLPLSPPLVTGPLPAGKIPQ